MEEPYCVRTSKSTKYKQWPCPRCLSLLLETHPRQPRRSPGGAEWSQSASLQHTSLWDPYPFPTQLVQILKRCYTFCLNSTWKWNRRISGYAINPLVPMSSWEHVTSVIFLPKIQNPCGIIRTQTHTEGQSAKQPACNRQRFQGENQGTTEELFESLGHTAMNPLAIKDLTGTFGKTSGMCVNAC